VAETEKPQIVGPVEKVLLVPEPAVPDDETIFLRMEQTPDGITRSFTARAWDAGGGIGSWTFQLDVQLDVQLPVEQETDKLREVELKRAGKKLFDSAFPGAVRRRLDAMLKRKLRLIVDLSSAGQDLSALPWEALCTGDAFPAVDGRLQVIRYMQPGKNAATPIVGFPIRMLAVIAVPRDAGPSSEGEALSLLDKVLGPATGIGVLRYSFLHGEIAPSQVSQAMLDNAPNIFHFFGYGSVNAATREGGILLGSKRGEFVGAGQVQSLIGMGNLGLAVLLGAETGSGRDVGVQNSVAGRLAISGIPAVIGTLRQIRVESALLFSQRFYSALLETGDVERALAEARKALARERWDWSAYALFSSVTRIDRLPFQPTSA